MTATNFKMYTGDHLQTYLIFIMANILLSWIFNVTDQRCHHGVHQSMLFWGATSGNCK